MARPPKSLSATPKRKAGRPTGAATVLTRRLANEIAESGNSPVAVMFENMMFWHTKTRALTEEVRRLVVNAENEEERAEAFKLLRDMLACRDKSQQCAVDLAPFCHARLASITMEKPPESPDVNQLPADPIESQKIYQRLISAG